MCVHIEYSQITGVKVLGPKLGDGPSTPNGEMVDGDGDGKCQEEGGKWVPCPPGVASGTKLVASARSVIDKAREAAKVKAAKIAEAAERALPQSNRDAAKRIRETDYSIPFINEIEAKFRARPVFSDYDDAAKYREAVDNYEKEKAQFVIDYRDRVLRQAQQDFSDAFNYTFKDLNGRELSTRLTSVLPNRSGLNMIGIIEDADGNEIGKFSRYFSFGIERTVNHDEFSVYERGNGIGSIVNAQNELLYKEMGITSINLNGVSSAPKAEGEEPYMIGATHWPRNGFDWADSMERDIFTDYVWDAIKFDREGKTLNGRRLFDSDEQREQIKELLDEADEQSFDDPDRLTAGDLLHWPGRTAWFADQEVGIAYKKEL